MTTTLKDLMKNIIPTYAANEETSWANAAAQFANYINENKTVTPQQLWADMLEYLQNETQAEYLRSKAGLPITEDLFNKTENITSLFEYINNNIDLPETFYSNLETEYKGYLGNSLIDLNQETGLSSSVTTYFWNESVSKLIAFLIRQFSSTGISKGVSIDWTSGSNNYSVDLKNIIQPDAWKGDEEYVNPAKNTSGTTYKTTRGVDLITSDATNTNNLSYTNTQSNYSLRLGMPKYERKVMVEDLDRNFWVISQCVATISAYLFEENSPLVQLFKDILSELVQLWENLLYLWAVFAIALHNEKVYTDVRCEVVALSISECYHLRKYDNFSSYSILNTTLTKVSLEDLLLKNLAYYEDEYPESNLVLMPFMRIDNYEHNYYREEWYPGLVFYDRNAKEWEVQLFQDFGVNSIFTEDGIAYGCKFSLESFVPSTNGFTSTPYKDAVWAITQAKRGESVGYFPYSEVENLEEWNNDTYYAAIRCLPNLNFTYEWDSDTSKGSFILDYAHEGVCGINVTDAIGQAIKKWANSLTDEEISSMTTYQQSLIPSIKTMNYLSCGFSIQYNSGKYVYYHGGGGTTYYDTPKTQVIDIAPFGYYLGELISGVSYSIKKYPELSVHSVYGRPFYNDMSVFELSENELKGDHSYFSSLQEKDRKDLNAWIERESATITEESKDFYLFTITHQYNLYETEDNYIQNYIDYDETTSTYNNYVVDQGNKPGLTISNPILAFKKYSSTIMTFIDTTLQREIPSTDTTLRYGGRSGNLFSSAQLWNPFGQKFLNIPQYFNYSRIILNPTENPNPALYDSDNNLIKYSDCRKMKSFVPLILFRSNGKFHLIDNISIIKNKFVSKPISSTSLKLFDKTQQITEENWAIRHWTATLNFNCIFSETQAHRQSSDSFLYKKGFNPFLKALTSSYSPTSYNNTAQITFNLLKNDCLYYWDINSEDLFQSGFYTLGYNLTENTDANKIAIQQDFNLLLDFAKRVNNITTFISANSEADNYLKSNYNIYAQMRNSGILVNFQTIFSHSSIQLYSSYATTVSALRVFPNGTHIITRVTTSDVYGYNKANNNKQIKTFSKNFDIEEWLPQFELVYDTSGQIDTDESWSAFAKQWNANGDVLYTIQSISECIDKDGTVNPFKSGKTSLNFGKYYNNGRISPLETN